MKTSMKRKRRSSGFAYAYGWNVYYQKTGLWPRDGEGPIGQRIAWVWAFLIFVCIWLPQAAGLIIAWGDLNSNIDCLSVNIPMGITVVKILTLQYQRKVTGSILVSITDDWTRVRSKKETEIMMETARISRLISILSISLSVVANSNYTVAQLWGVMHIKKDPATVTRLTTGLPFESYFPFDTTSMNIFVPLWIAQCLSSLIAATSYTGPDALVSMMVLHVCGQIRVIRHSLKHLAAEGPQKYWRTLGAIVTRHEELNQLAFIIKETFSSILLVQMLACTLTFCFQGYVIFLTVMDASNDAQFSVLDTMFAVVSSVFTITHLFIYCWVGDRLLVESSTLSDGFYETAWYNLAPEEARAFLFVCHRSKTPLQITAGKFCTFNLELFNSIMKNSMGYLSILMAMKDRLID